jgi:hypothetical protein
MAKKSADKSSGTKSKVPPAPKEHWGTEPEDHDYPAASDYLSLIMSASEVRRLTAALRSAPIETRKAKDLLRASGLALLPMENAHVSTDLSKVADGKKLSPVLLVRGDVRHGVPLQVADGYHRICASYHIDENADIPCHIVDLNITRSRTATRTRSSRGPTTVQ